MRKISQEQRTVLMRATHDMREWLWQIEELAGRGETEKLLSELHYDQDTMPPALDRFMMAIVHLEDGTGQDIVNVCEHGDHPAPEGDRFCSEECQRCEVESTNEETGCDNICGLGENEPSAKPPNCT